LDTHRPVGRGDLIGVSLDALTVLSAVPAGGCFQPSRIRSTTIMPDETTQIIVGVDTHTDTHAAVAINQLGRRLGTLQIRADESGYRSLLEWANQLGELSCFGVEGTVPTVRDYLGSLPTRDRA
jgi:hypothetical protein